MLFIPELNRGNFQSAFALNIGLFWAVNHDVADLVIAQQFFQRAKAQKLIDQHFLKSNLFAPVERDFQLIQHVFGNWPKLLAELVMRQSGCGFGINPFQKAGENLLFNAVDRGPKAVCCATCVCRAIGSFKQAAHRVRSCGLCCVGTCRGLG